jgi:TrmH family RNA methyltransferase
MLSTAARAHLTTVLVGARNPLNIGAAARALHDFGFSHLHLVNDFAAPFEAAQLDSQLDASSSAIAARSVLQNACRFDTLPAAIADATLIVGTTAIGVRELTQPILPLQQAAPQILAALAAHHNVALLFGSEKTGLTNDQLSHCHLLTTIPLFSPAATQTEPIRHLSMNLGQSVAVCLYELTRDGLEHAVDIPTLHEAPSTSDDRERLTHLLLDVLQTTGYTRRFPANATEPLIRQLTLQLGASHRESITWMGILRQILWHERNPPSAT